MLPWPDLLPRVPEVLELLLFRAHPMVAYVLLSRAIGLRTKLWTVLPYAALIAGLLRLGIPAERIALGFAPLLFCALMALLVYRLRDMLAGGLLSRGALFSLCFLLFQLLPALLAPVSLPITVLGWEMVLSAYSYALDTQAPSRRTGVAECVFFIVVNPALVFAERGKSIGAPALRPRALARIAFGLATLLAYHALPVPAALSAGALEPFGAGYLSWLRVYGVRLVRAALAHSGLASVQIGLMRSIGYAIPERYHFALLARSPSEFWRRWNTWIGHWARRYLFTPLALAQGRVFRKQPRLLTNGVAALATFAAVGLWHDAFFLLRGLRGPETTGPLRWTLGFTLFGVLFAGWLAAEPVLRNVLGAEPKNPALRVLRGTLSWLLFMHGLLLVIWAVDPDRSAALVFAR